MTFEPLFILCICTPPTHTCAHVYVCMHMLLCGVQIRGEFTGVSFILPQFGFHEVNSDLQAGCQAPLSPESSLFLD